MFAKFRDGFHYTLLAFKVVRSMVLPSEVSKLDERDPFCFVKNLRNVCFIILVMEILPSFVKRFWFLFQGICIPIVPLLFR